MIVKRKSIEQALARALASGGDFAEIFLECRRISSIGLEAGRIEKVHSGLDQGAGIRLLAGDSSIYVYTNDISPSGLLKAATDANMALKQKLTDVRLPALTEEGPAQKQPHNNVIEIDQ